MTEPKPPELNLREPPRLEIHSSHRGSRGIRYEILKIAKPPFQHPSNSKPPRYHCYDHRMEFRKKNSIMDHSTCRSNNPTSCYPEPLWSSQLMACFPAATVKMKYLPNAWVPVIVSLDECGENPNNRPEATVCSS